MYNKYSLVPNFNDYYNSGKKLYQSLQTHYCLKVLSGVGALICLWIFIFLPFSTIIKCFSDFYYFGRFLILLFILIVIFVLASKLGVI